MFDFFIAATSFFARFSKSNLLGNDLLNTPSNELLNTEYVTATISGSMALLMSLLAANIKPGDEIIVPTWTMCASAIAILHWNAIPVFADIEDETFNIDPSSIIKKINKKTKAIICVDIFGHPANMKEIMKIAKNKKLKVIADNAQAPGSKYFNKFESV